jgi:trk system potassium uptake protein TrkA
MRVIICGAGRVGLSIAGYLCQQNNHVTIIDNDIELIKNIVNTHDIHGIHGHASQPETLKKAGIERADVIIAVTDCDEVNMVACQVAHSIFGISKKIARIRDRNYRDPAWSQLYSRNHMPIDLIISPEEEIAQTIHKRMIVPGTTNDIHLHDNNLHIFGLIASKENGLTENTVKSIHYKLKDIYFSVVLVIRDHKSFFVDDNFVIQNGDEIYFALKKTHLFSFLDALGIKSNNAGHIIICGGGEIGLFLSECVAQDTYLKSKNLTIIESDLGRARFLNRAVENALVLNGSAIESDLLNEAGVANASIFVSVMNSNENNILSAMIAKKMGANYTLALSTNRIYNQLLSDRNLDAIINPEVVTVSKVLKYLRRGRIISVNSLRQGYAELIEAEVTENCSIANVMIKEINMPEGVKIISIYNQSEGKVQIPNSDTVIQCGNIVSVVSLTKDIAEVEKLFSFSIDLF